VVLWTDLWSVGVICQPVWSGRGVAMACDSSEGPKDRRRGEISTEIVRSQGEFMRLSRLLEDSYC